VPIERRVQSGPLKLLQSVEVELGGLAGQGRGVVRRGGLGGQVRLLAEVALLAEPAVAACATLRPGAFFQPSCGRLRGHA